VLGHVSASSGRGSGALPRHLRREA
jgi:hypothetical protein